MLYDQLHINLIKTFYGSCNFTLYSRVILYEYDIWQSFTPFDVCFENCRHTNDVFCSSSPAEITFYTVTRNTLITVSIRGNLRSFIFVRQIIYNRHFCGFKRWNLWHNMIQNKMFDITSKILFLHMKYSIAKFDERYSDDEIHLWKIQWQKLYMFCNT